MSENTEKQQEFYEVTLHNIMGGVVNWATEYITDDKNFKKCSCSFHVPDRKYYDTFYLIFEPDLVDKTRPLKRLFAGVAAEWDTSYMVKTQMLKGTREELLDYLKSPKAFEDVKQMIVHLDKDTSADR